METAKLELLNSSNVSEAQTELLKCCGSRQFAGQVVAQRPFESLDQLITTADRVWWALEPRDWLEAFRSHPKIGEKKPAAAVSNQSKRWSEAEQSGTSNAATQTREALAELNQKYEEKFGYIFIVCATGKSSEEMLEILRGRLENDTDQELPIAAAEQAKITRLRLQKLVGG